MPTTPKPTSRARAGRLASVYALAGIVWIVGSELVVGLLPRRFGSLVLTEIVKDLGFVLITAVVLYVAVLRRERRLLKEKARLDVLLGQLPGLVWTTDRTLRIESVGGGVDSLSFASRSLVGVPVMDTASTPEAAAVIESSHRRALAGEPADYTVDLAQRTFAVRVEPLRDVADSVTGTVGFALEIPSAESGDGSSVRDALQRARFLGALGSLLLDVAHQLKNPLFALSAALDAFEQRTGPDPGTERHRAILREQVARIDNLVSGLQVYGRTDTLSFQDVDLRRPLERAVRDIAPLAQAAQMEVDLRQPPDGIRVRADPDALAGALRRVLENAVQHAPRGSTIGVTVTPISDAVRVSVEDRGPGFDPEDLERVFAPLHSRRPDGAGLGLAIAERIVQRHGGRVEADNRPGGGARVSFVLPADGGRRPGDVQGL